METVTVDIPYWDDSSDEYWVMEAMKTATNKFYITNMRLTPALTLENYPSVLLRIDRREGKIIAMAAV